MTLIFALIIANGEDLPSHIPTPAILRDEPGTNPTPVPQSSPTESSSSCLWSHTQILKLSRYVLAYFYPKKCSFFTFKFSNQLFSAETAMYRELMKFIFWSGNFITESLILQFFCLHMKKNTLNSTLMTLL